MNDKGFLIWLHERLEFQHRENPNSDFMIRLRSIISKMPDSSETIDLNPKCICEGFFRPMNCPVHGRK